MNKEFMRLGKTILMLGLVAVPSPASAFSDTLSKWLQRTPFPIIHSKHAAVSRGTFYRLSWLDNDRILFAGEPVEEILARYDGKRFVRAVKVKFYIWEIRTNHVTTYREKVNSFGTFCYNEYENWIRYPAPGVDGAVMEGVLGAEKVVQISTADQSRAGRAERGVYFHDLTCREYPYAPNNVGVSERRTFPLFADHGILDIWGKRTDPAPVRWFSSDYQRSVELDLLRRAVAPEKIFYSKYLGSYVLTGYTAPPSFSNNWGDWPSGVDQPVYALSVSRQLTMLGRIPWREGYRAALAVLPTAKGLAYATGRPPKDGGVFLVTDGKTVPLLRISGLGSILAAGVSPDGCKLGAAFAMDGGNEDGGLRVVHLCGAGGRWGWVNDLGELT